MNTGNCLFTHANVLLNTMALSLDHPVHQQPIETSDFLLTGKTCIQDIR